MPLRSSTVDRSRMHPLRLIIAILGLLCLLGSTSGAAEAVSGLFEADVPVGSQDDAARDAAVRAGLEAVLVKLAGTRRVLENPAVAAELSSASRHVLQFYFRRAEAPPDAPGTARPEMLMHISFRPSAVQELLRRAGEPMLSANRPRTLLWVVVDDGTGRHLLNQDTDARAVTGLLQAAGERATPLLFPLLDLEDSLAITTDQVWEFDAEAVTAASARYGTPEVVSARFVYTSTAGWIGEWRQQREDGATWGEGQGASLAELGAGLVDFVAEGLAARFGIRADLANAEELRIRVDGIRDFRSYRELNGLLRRLGSVRETRLALLDRDTVVFDLLTDSGTESVERELGLLRQLGAAGEPGERRFVWLGG